MNQKTKNVILIVLLTVCAAVFGICCYKLIKAAVDYKQAEKNEDEAIELLFDGMYVEETFIELKPVEQGKAVSTVAKDYEDLVGVLTVPILRQPTHLVFQADDNDLYLHHNRDKKYAYAGEVFCDYQCDPTLGKPGSNLIIYGHRMKNGTGFGNLTKLYDEATFRDDNSVFYYATADAVYEVRIFAVYRTRLSEFRYLKSVFKDSDEFMSYIEACKAHSLFDCGVDVGPEDKIITLSSCDYAAADDGRCVIQGVAVKIADTTEGN